MGTLVGYMLAITPFGRKSGSKASLRRTAQRLLTGRGRHAKAVLDLARALAGMIAAGLEAMGLVWVVPEAVVFKRYGRMLVLTRIDLLCAHRSNGRPVPVEGKFGYLEDWFGSSHPRLQYTALKPVAAVRPCPFNLAVLQAVISADMLAEMMQSHARQLQSAVSLVNTGGRLVLWEPKWATQPAMRSRVHSALRKILNPPRIPRVPAKAKAGCPVKKKKKKKKKKPPAKHTTRSR